MKNIALIAALAAAGPAACGPPNVIIDRRGTDGGGTVDAAPTPDAQPMAECIRHSDCPLGLECASGRCIRPQAPVDAGVADASMSTDSGTCTPAVEVCNGRDDDCDTQIDEGLENIGTCVAQVQQATNFVPVPGRLRCEAGRLACAVDCRVGEICNGLDDDCDGVVDEGCPRGADAGVSTDGGTVIADSGAGVADAGTPADSGTAVADTGPIADASVTPDAGMAAADAGVATDAGTAVVDAATAADAGGAADAGFVRTGTGTVYLVIEYPVPSPIQPLLSGPRLGSQIRGGWTYDDLQIISGGSTGILARASFSGVTRTSQLDLNGCFRFCADVTIASGGGEWFASSVLRVPPTVRAGTNPTALVAVTPQLVDNGRGGRNERINLSAVP